MMAMFDHSFLRINPMADVNHTSAEHVLRSACDMAASAKQVLAITLPSTMAQKLATADWTIQAEAAAAIANAMPSSLGLTADDVAFSDADGRERRAGVSVAMVTVPNTDALAQATTWLSACGSRVSFGGEVYLPSLDGQDDCSTASTATVPGSLHIGFSGNTSHFFGENLRVEMTAWLSMKLTTVAEDFGLEISVSKVVLPTINETTSYVKVEFETNAPAEQLIHFDDLYTVAALLDADPLIVEDVLEPDVHLVQRGVDAVEPGNELVLPWIAIDVDGFFTSLDEISQLEYSAHVVSEIKTIANPLLDTCPGNMNKRCNRIADVVMPSIINGTINISLSVSMTSCDVSSVVSVLQHTPIASWEDRITGHMFVQRSVYGSTNPPVPAPLNATDHFWPKASGCGIDQDEDGPPPSAWTVESWVSLGATPGDAPVDGSGGLYTPGDNDDTLFGAPYTSDLVPAEYIINFDFDSDITGLSADTIHTSILARVPSWNVSKVLKTTIGLRSPTTVDVVVSMSQTYVSSVLVTIIGRPIVVVWNSVSYTQIYVTATAQMALEPCEDADAGANDYSADDADVDYVNTPLNPAVEPRQPAHVSLLKDHSVMGFYTNAAMDVAFNIMVINSVVEVHWGQFSFVTRLTVSADVWHHVSCSWRDIDGRVQVCVAAAGGNIACEARHGILLAGASGIYGTVQLGKALKYRDTVDIALVGAVDSVRVWNVARSATEIVEHINAPLPNGAPGLVIDFDLDNSVDREGEAPQATFAQYACDSTEVGPSFLAVEMGATDGCTRTKFKKGRIGYKTTTSTTTTSTTTTTSKTSTTLTNTTTTTTTYKLTVTTTTVSTTTEDNGSGDNGSGEAPDDTNTNGTNATNATDATNATNATNATDSSGSDSGGGPSKRIVGTGGTPGGDGEGKGGAQAGSEQTGTGTGGGQAQGGQAQDGGGAQSQGGGDGSQGGAQAQGQGGGDGGQGGGSQAQGDGSQGGVAGGQEQAGSGQYTYGPPTVPTILTSTAPIDYPDEVPKCAFQTPALKAEAMDTCSQWFEEGELVEECGALGPETFAFFGETCLCDVASANDIDQYRVSVCALALMCIDVGATELENLYDAHCFNFDSTTTTTTTQRLGASATGIEGRRRWVWELLLCALICMIVLTLWYLIMFLLSYFAEKDEEIVVKSNEPIVLPKDGYLASASSPFAEITDAQRGSIPAFAMELEPITNPLYGKSKLEKKNSKKPKRSSEGNLGNYQDGRDNQYIDLSMFDVDGTYVEQVEEDLGVSNKEDPHKILLAELAEQPWQKITVDVSDVDVTFSLDGKVIRTNRLPEPIEDIPGDGSLLVGARHPKEHRFTGEIKALHFTESVKEPATPDDAPGFGGRPPGPGSLLKDTPINMLAIGDDARRMVKPGSEKSSKLFDGGFHTSLNVPTQLHPELKEYGCPTCFRVEATFKQKVGTSGYIMAKTDSAGLSRYWALGVVSTKDGQSFQFYYRPKGSVRGHRLTLANEGMFNEATMDPDHVITGQLDDQEEMSTAEMRAATTADAINAKSAKDKFVQLEENAKKKPEALDRESIQAPAKRKASSAIKQKMKAMGAATEIDEAGLVGEVDEEQRLEQMKAELVRLDTRETELTAVIAASTTLRNSAAEAERVAGLKDAEVRKLQADLKAAEVRASRAAASRDAKLAEIRQAAAADQGAALAAMLKPASKPANLGKATHLSLSAGVQPVTAPGAGGAAEGAATIQEMVAVLSLFPDLN
jgi:hypothetical protein